MEAVTRLEKLTAALAETFTDTARSTWDKSTSALRTSAEQLAIAASALAETTARLDPSIAHLVPELAALSRETALLASRVDDAEVDEAVLSEMQRFGEAVGEIKALLTLGRPDRGAREELAAE